MVLAGGKLCFRLMQKAPSVSLPLLVLWNDDPSLCFLHLCECKRQVHSLWLIARYPNPIGCVPGWFPGGAPGCFRGWFRSGAPDCVCDGASGCIRGDVSGGVPGGVPGVARASPSQSGSNSSFTFIIGEGGGLPAFGDMPRAGVNTALGLFSVRHGGTTWFIRPDGTTCLLLPGCCGGGMRGSDLARCETGGTTWFLVGLQFAFLGG